MPEEGCLLHDSFGILDEVDDIVYLVTHRYLVFNLLQGILHAEVSLVYQTVGIYDMAQYTFAHLVFVLKHSSVDTVVFCRITVHNNIRRYVFRDAATCLNQYQLPM